MISRRTLLSSGALAAGAIGSPFGRGTASAEQAALPASITALTSMRGQATPISREERQGRVEKARRLMAEHKIDALMLTGGTSLVYFSGIQWGLSERLFSLVVPRAGQPFVVCPAFEEDRAREQFATSPFTGTADVRTWEEHESPYQRLAQGLKDRGVATGRLGVEETVRHMFVDGVAQAAPGAGARQRHAGHRRLPHGEGRARAGLDEDRLRRHAQGLRGGVAGPQAGHDADRVPGPDRGGPRQAGLPRRRQRADRQVLGPAPRLDHAAGDRGRLRSSSSTAAARWKATSRTSAARSCSAGRPTR